MAGSKADQTAAEKGRMPFNPQALCADEWSDAGYAISRTSPPLFMTGRSVLVAGRILPPPERLKDHVHGRFLPPPGNAFEPLVSMEEALGDGLDRLDPVCLMDPDPATARHTTEHAGRIIALCARARSSFWRIRRLT
jgi:hypothetical protein